MINYLKILKTNWIHLAGFYISTYCSMIIFHMVGLERYSGYNWLSTLLVSIIGIPFVFFTYGLTFMVAFYIAIVLLDLIIFHFTKLKVLTVAIIEWIIIMPPFIYWAFKEDYWLWLVLVISLLVTQLIRIKMIKSVKGKIG